MKGHRYTNFVKGAALSALAIATVTATAFSLTACGSGGGTNEDTILLRRNFEGKFLVFEPQSTNAIMIAVHESNGQTTNAFFADVYWGKGTGSIDSNGVFSIRKFDKSADGKTLTGFEFQMSSHSASLTTGTGFKAFWSIPDGITGLVTQDMFFKVTNYKQKLGDTSMGDFAATTSWSGNDTTASGSPAKEGDSNTTGILYIYDDSYGW